MTHPEPESPDRSKESILEEAQRLTSGPRQDAYGHPLDDYMRTAEIWNALLKHKLAPGQSIEWADALRCMCSVKLSRDVHSMSRDNMTDLAGYARCRQEALEEEERRGAYHANTISLRD